MCQGFSAVLLPQLTQPDSLITVDAEEASWIASLGVVSTPLGALVSGAAAEILGRKATVQVTTLPFLAGWLLMAFSTDKLALYAGRFITGFAIGMAATCYVYVAELSEPGMRGALASLGPVFVSLGVLAVYLLGYLFRWQEAAMACAAVAFASCCLIHLLPETPAWLASRRRYEEALAILVRLRGDPDKAHAELLQAIQSAGGTEEELSWSSYLGQWKSPTVWKPFTILVIYFLLQEASGLYVVLYYATGLFQEIGSEMDSGVESIIVGGMRLAMSAVGSVLIQKCRRRSLAAASGLGMGITMAAAAAYEHLFGSIALNHRPYPMFPSVCILLNVCASMMGMLQLPWLMIGELFPLPVRGVMSGIVSSLAYFFIFAIVKLYPNMLSLLKMSGLMWFFAGSSLITIIFAKTFLPETQGKRLIDIENSFRKRSFSKSKKTEDAQIKATDVYVVGV